MAIGSPEEYEKIFNEILIKTLDECYYKEGFNKDLIKNEGVGKFKYSVALGKTPSTPVTIKFNDIIDIIIDKFDSIDENNTILDKEEIIKIAIKEYLEKFIDNERRRPRL
ncbi:MULTISPECIES: hypothetical protein [Clostridium]|uniref:hypothetical protein n=1 Tax=Clostridium TaxID=1485 RepID=UPI000826B973|nr:MULTISPECIES: hypothetical protein [Clostridium]PJI09962.1 hypothetical protein CUB90_19735 [Clostridium sp. CT7]